MIFWYAIEKLFQAKIGITTEQIVLIGILAQGSQVIFELPTSVFADRWSRRNILLCASLAMVVCCVILGLSSTVAVYAIGILFWSLSDALSSGVYEAFAYDSISTSGHKRLFQKIYSRMKSGELVSMALAGIAAGIIGAQVNLRLVFFMSIIPAVVCIVLLLRLQEPAIQPGAGNILNWRGHLGDAFKNMLGSSVRWPAAVYICLFGFLAVWFEYYQLLGLDIKLSPAVFGLLISILTLGMMVGAEIAHRQRATKQTLMLIWAVLIITHLIGLRFVAPVVALGSLFLTFVALQLQEIYLEVYLQDNIPSERRATIMSLMSTLGYAWFFVLAVVFATALKPFGIRGALTLTSLPLLILGIIDIAKGIPWAPYKKSAKPLGEELEL